MSISDRAAQLVAARTPFVRATVVRAQQPTSARPGDEAILLADGTIEGFVGGHCAQNSVVLDTTLIRLQCYEGLTANEALYDWNYQRQLLSIRLAEARGKGISDISEADLYTEAYLVDRPILRCVRHRGPTPPVLLIDEIDRADDEFEALLLEFLGESAVTVPELGTFLAECPPIAVLTSNRSRDLHDALRRRCLYHWIDYPGPDRAAAIVRRTVPGATAPLIENATQFVCTARDLDLDKPPGVAETIDWVAALVALGVADLTAADSSPALASLGALAKTPDDRTQIRDAYQAFTECSHA